MAEKIGVVQTVDSTGQAGSANEIGTTPPTPFDFVVVRPNVYVVPGQSVKVVVSTPNNRVIIAPPVVIEINGSPI